MSGLRKSYTEQMFRDLHARHLAGCSVLQLSRETGLDRRTFYRRWEMLGLKGRNMSEAASERYVATTAEYRQRITEAAHDAVRGVKREHSELRERSQSQQHRVESVYEQIVLDYLRDAGFYPIANMAADKFRIDIALPDRMLAIEIDGGGWHAWGRKARQDAIKESALRAMGWDIIRLTGGTEHRFRLHGCDLVAYLEGRSRRPPIARINGVIPRDPQDVRSDPKLEQIFADAIARQRKNFSETIAMRKNRVTDNDALDGYDATR